MYVGLNILYVRGNRLQTNKKLMAGFPEIYIFKTKTTRASERKHSWATRLTARWPQFRVIQ